MLGTNQGAEARYPGPLISQFASEAYAMQSIGGNPRIAFLFASTQVNLIGRVSPSSPT